MRRNLVLLLGLAFLLLLSAPARAGGWAVVHLDEEPGDVVVDTPLQFGFTVLQHDVTPTNAVEVVITASHLETGDVISASATQEGPAGHFIAELTLPHAGNWKWEIEPRPFAATTLETLYVSDARTAPDSFAAQFIAGMCARGRSILAGSPGKSAAPVGD